MGSRADLLPVEQGVVSITVGKGSALPGVFALSSARPNPFNPSTTIAYDIPQQAHVTLAVYNLLGQEVVRLVDGVKQPGRYTVVWNARNASSQVVASGVYFYHRCRVHAEPPDDPAEVSRQWYGYASLYACIPILYLQIESLACNLQI